jgi:hypothetical protein
MESKLKTCFLCHFLLTLLIGQSCAVGDPLYVFFLLCGSKYFPSEGCLPSLPNHRAWCSCGTWSQFQPLSPVLQYNNPHCAMIVQLSNQLLCIWLNWNHLLSKLSGRVRLQLHCDHQPEQRPWNRQYPGPDSGRLLRPVHHKAAAGWG